MFSSLLLGLGGWYSYRMSKAALSMATRNLSIELGRSRPKVQWVWVLTYGIIPTVDIRPHGYHHYNELMDLSLILKVVCVSLHPGTVNTDLSRPYHRNVPKDKLFNTEQSVNYLMSIIDTLNIEKTGKAYSWDGKDLPW